MKVFIDETNTRIRYDVSHRKAVIFLDLINEAVEKGLLLVLWVDPKTAKETGRQGE